MITINQKTYHPEEIQDIRDALALWGTQAFVHEYLHFPCDYPEWDDDFVEIANAFEQDPEILLDKIRVAEDVLAQKWANRICEEGFERLLRLVQPDTPVYVDNKHTVLNKQNGYVITSGRVTAGELLASIEAMPKHEIVFSRLGKPQTLSAVYLDEDGLRLCFQPL